MNTDIPWPQPGSERREPRLRVPPKRGKKTRRAAPRRGKTEATTKRRARSGGATGHRVTDDADDVNERGDDEVSILP